MIRGQMNSDQYRKKGCSIQGATNCGASSDPDFIQKYFLLKRIFDFQHSLSPSLALPFPPWVSTSFNPGFQDCANNGTLLNRWLSLKVHHNSNNPMILNNYLTFTVTTETVQ